MRRKHDFSGKLNPRAEEEVFGGRLYKSGARSGANNAKSSGKRSSGIAVPYQPVRGAARVLGTKNAANTTKGGTLKLKLKRPRSCG